MSLVLPFRRFASQQPSKGVLFLRSAFAASAAESVDTDWICTMERIKAEEEAMEEKPESIRPPRLEDAGLEDCALSPESIMEAFYRAAVSLKYSDSSVFSIAVDDDDHGDRCVQDPSLSNCQIPDKIFCADGVSQPVSSVCGAMGNQAEHHDFNDAVVVIGAGDGEAATGSVVVVDDGGDGVETKESELDG